MSKKKKPDKPEKPLIPKCGSCKQPLTQCACTDNNLKK